MIVVDASAVLEILSRTAKGLELEAALLNGDLHAPHVIDLEVLNAVRRWERNGVIGGSEASDIIEVFLAMDISRYSHKLLLDAIWATRYSLTAYDAAYLVLAKALDAELVTMDSGLQKMAARKKPR
jgi:predicted nucleic acid-binding protein